MAKNVRRSRGIAVGAACTWRAGVDGLDLPLVPARPIRTGCGFRADLVRSPCMRGTLATLAFGVGAGGVAGLSRLVDPGSLRTGLHAFPVLIGGGLALFVVMVAVCAALLEWMRRNGRRDGATVQ